MSEFIETGKYSQPTAATAGGIYSQANNFLSVVQSAVDPRTGQFNLAISLPSLLANNLSGPSLAVTWGFSSLSSQRDQGYGLGWSILLSMLVNDGNVPSLRLTSGEQFAIDAEKSNWGVGGELVFSDQKLKVLKVTVLSGERFRVEHKSGEVEILKRAGKTGRYLLDELRSPEGRRLTLDWLSTQDSDMLREIKDETRTLMRVEVARHEFVVYLTLDDLKETSVRFSLFDDVLESVYLQGIDKPFRFSYESRPVGHGQQLIFPISITGPLGAEDTIDWSQSGHELSEGAPYQWLPRVTGWSHRSGGADSTLYRTYEWLGNSNFLGFGSSVGFNWEDGRDNLYQVNRDYEYSVTEKQQDRTGRVLSTITRTWNRFHLQTLETTITGDCEVKVETTYGIDPDESWDNQKPSCQLPHDVKTTWINGKTKAERSQQVTYEYDDYGNILHTRYPTGVEERSEYYPVAGEPGKCPRDASGMVRRLKKKTVTPSSLEKINQLVADQADHGKDAQLKAIIEQRGVHGGAPTLSTNYVYVDLPSLIAGEPPFSLVTVEELWDDTNLLEKTSQDYELDAKSPHYGRQTTASTTVGGKTTVTQFDYELLAARLRTSVTIKGFEANELNSSCTQDERSLITGLTALELSPAGVKTQYEYDELGRVVHTKVAPDTDFKAERTCNYHLQDSFVEDNAPTIIGADPSKPSVGLEERDATKQRKRSWLDGRGRVVLVQMEDIDNPPENPADPAKFFDVAASVYDALGREKEKTTWDWCAGQTEPLLKLTITTDYDDWGSVKKQVGPTGVISHSLHDPIALRTEQWQESPTGKLSSKQVTFSNVAGSPLREELYDDNGRLVRTTHYTRDGLDRVIEQCVEPTVGAQIKTVFEYDAYSRIVRRTLPDGTAVVWKYLAHSDGDHPESITVEPAPATGKVFS